LACALLLAVSAPSTASAAVMTYMGLDDLVEDSDLVVRGEVEDRRTFEDDERGEVFTRTTIEISKTYLGDDRGKVTVEQFGGTLDGTTHRIPGDAEFEVGEDVIVFLAENRGSGSSPYYLVGLAQSKFDVVGRGDDARVTRDMRDVAVRPKEGSDDEGFDGLGEQTWTLPAFEAELESLVYSKSQGAR
jgi:hypothetical protein